MSEEIKNKIISYALDELLHNWKDSDAENLQMDCDDIKDLSEDEIKELITTLTGENLTVKF